MTDRPPSAGALAPYQQIKQDVARQIAAGRWGTGARLPSDNELAAAFQVSRLTAHRALRELAQEGLVQRVHGVGTFVAARRETSAAETIYNIADEIRSAGKALTAVVVRLSPVAATGVVAQEMAVDEGAPLFHSAVVYRSDGVPIQLEDRFVAPRFAPDYLGQDFEQGSTTDYLQAIAPADRAEHVIEAVMPDATSRTLLGIAKGEPCLVVLRKTWVEDRITTFTRFIHPGSRRRLVSRLARSSRDRQG